MELVFCFVFLVLLAGAAVTVGIKIVPQGYE